MPASSSAASPITLNHCCLWLSQLKPCSRISFPVASGLNLSSSFTGILLRPSSCVGCSSTAAGLVIRDRILPSNSSWLSKAVREFTLSCSRQRSWSARVSSCDFLSDSSSSSCSARGIHVRPGRARPVRERQALLLVRSLDGLADASSATSSLDSVDSDAKIPPRNPPPLPSLLDPAATGTTRWLWWWCREKPRASGAGEGRTGPPLLATEAEPCCCRALATARAPSRPPALPDSPGCCAASVPSGRERAANVCDLERPDCSKTVAPASDGDTGPRVAARAVIVRRTTRRRGRETTPTTSRQWRWCFPGGQCEWRGARLDV
mmetsp:Transcript_9648/g.27599  ORF Transcript_9648/g.27599 Transcript_9648/m.27599 type:complete len:321 (+) Transcript_9648:1309-2271(+)